MNHRLKISISRSFARNQILSINRSSRRLISMTIPSYLLCRSNTVRYIFAINVYDRKR